MFFDWQIDEKNKRSNNIDESQNWYYFMNPFVVKYDHEGKNGNVSLTNGNKLNSEK